MSRMNPDMVSEARKCIEEMRAEAKNFPNKFEKTGRWEKIYKSLYPDWETEPDREHYFFLSMSFVMDAIEEYRNWLNIVARDWEAKLDGRQREDS